MCQNCVYKLSSQIQQWKFTQSRAKIWQNLNKASKISKKFQNFAKSGHTVTNVDFKLIYINQEKARSRVRLSNSVTRFGEISPLWQNFKSLWNF